MNDQAKELERYAEQLVRGISSANNQITTLIRVIRDIEKLAASADKLDMRNAFSLKSDLSTLEREVNKLTQNLQTLQFELNDTGSKLRRALY